MRNLRRFETVAELNAAIANSTIGLVGLAFDDSGKPVIRNKKVEPTPPAPDPTIPFYVENITNSDETLSIGVYDSSGQYGSLEFPVYYSTDGTTWGELGTTGQTKLTRTLSPGDKVYLRAQTDKWYIYDSEPVIEIENSCTINGVSKVGGNIMSLLYGSNFTGNETGFPSGSNRNFSNIFTKSYGDDKKGINDVLTDASELILPATTLADFCYGHMFRGCTSLATAPELPATTLAKGCYECMFEGCTSLTKAPVLPATTLANYCYNFMFYGCTSLTTAPALPVTTLANNCYQNMFSNCTSLATAPALPATTLANYCYSFMFSGCTSLTTAPELLATTLAGSCYYYMFRNCTNLNYIKCLATDIPIYNSTYSWVEGVSSTGTFVKDPSMSTWETGANGIPEGWTVQEATE